MLHLVGCLVSVITICDSRVRHSPICSCMRLCFSARTFSVDPSVRKILGRILGCRMKISLPGKKSMGLS